MDKKAGYGRFTFSQHALFEVILHLCLHFITVTCLILLPQSCNSIDSVCVLDCYMDGVFAQNAYLTLQIREVMRCLEICHCKCLYV